MDPLTITLIAVAAGTAITGGVMDIVGQQQQADFNEETSCFRISFFQNGHFYDEIILNITADEDGVYSDIDKWQMKCLDLSAELFDYEMGHKPNG